MKFRFINQLESNDCGPACLAMVTDYYGQEVSLKRIKELCDITRMGVSVKDILEGGKKLGLESHGLKLTSSQLTEIPLPAILFWKQDHFVVLHNIKEKRGEIYYYIADPGYGKTVIDKDLLEKEWIGNNVKGVCLVFQVTDKFKISKEKSSSYKRNKLLDHLLNFVKNNKFRYTLSFILLIIGLASNWLIPIIFRKIIDDGIIAKSLDLVFVLLLAQLFLFLGNFSSRLFSDYLLIKFNFNLSIILKRKFP